MDINKPTSTVILFIIILMLIFLFVIPKYQESTDLEMRLEKKQAQYEGQSQYYAKIFDLLKNLKDRNDALVKIDSALPSNFSFGPLIYFLQKRADESGLVITSITFSPMLPVTSEQGSSATPGQEVRTITFTLGLSGSYQGLKSFIGALENSARLLQIDAISFTSPQPLLGVKPSQTQSPASDFKLEVKTQTY